MRPERIAPATWLLAAAAAWAVFGAALAWAGLGGRIPAGAAGSVAAQPLPQAIADADIGPPADYATLAARPPFAQDRLPHPFSLPGSDGEDARGDASAFDYALTSVIITPRLRLAIVEPSTGGESVRVREGETAEGLGGWRLLELRPRAAVFEGPGGRRELQLRLWAGGGEGSAPAAIPPVAVQAPSASQPDAPASRPLSPQSASPVPDAPSLAGGGGDPAATAPAPTQVQQQMDAIRRRIEARRAQLRSEARQDDTQASPARNP